MLSLFHLQLIQRPINYIGCYKVKIIKKIGFIETEETIITNIEIIKCSNKECRKIIEKHCLKVMKKKYGNFITIKLDKIELIFKLKGK